MCLMPVCLFPPGISPTPPTQVHRSCFFPAAPTAGLCLSTVPPLPLSNQFSTKQPEESFKDLRSPLHSARPSITCHHTRVQLRLLTTVASWVIKAGPCLPLDLLPLVCPLSASSHSPSLGTSNLQIHLPEASSVFTCLALSSPPSVSSVPSFQRGSR